MGITRTSRRPTIVVDLLLEDVLPVPAVGNPLQGVRADSPYAADVPVHVAESMAAVGAAASRSDGRVDLERVEAAA